MNGGASQFARVLATLSCDTPLADRWHQLGEDIEQHGRDIDEALEAHRADCRARYGHDFGGGQ